MHRAIGMRRLGTGVSRSSSASRRLCRTIEEDLHHHKQQYLRGQQTGPMTSSASTGRRRPLICVEASTQQHGRITSNFPITSGVPVLCSRGWVSSTAPVFKGRKGGASALVQKTHRSKRKRLKDNQKQRDLKEKSVRMSAQEPPVEGKAKWKSKKVVAAEAEVEKARADEAMVADLKTITPEQSRELQRLAEEFLDTPIGDEELGEKPAMRKDNADKRMEQLGMSTKESEFFKQRALSTLGYGIQWKKVPLKEALAEAIRKGRVPAELAEGMKLLEGARTMAGEESSLAQTLENRALAFTPDGGGHGQLKRAGGDLTMADLKRSTDFNHLIRVLSVQGRFEEAWLRVLPEMDKRGIKRTAFTFSALLAGAAEDRNPEVAEWLWRDMVARGIPPEETLYNSRINAHCRAKRLDEAFKIGDEMREAGFPWNTSTYTIMIVGCNAARQFDRTWETYKDMVKNGVQPDVITYGAVIKMCADLHQYERAMKFCREMEEIDGISPTRGMIDTLIRAAAKAPQWIRPYGDVVDDLVIKMKGLKIYPSEQTYRALMFAYGNGGDADRVMQCLEEVHELRGHDVNNMGNGVPLLAVSTYCAALNALAACCSVGMKNGTRPRWGIMPGDEIPLRDISPVKVPKADADYLKSLKSQAMEWDEELEAEIKKGKKQRVKFRGVTTPEDLIEDDEWERMVEAEHSRVMRKAKEAEVEREREHKISIGIDPDVNFDHQRPCLFPDPAGTDRYCEGMPAWLGGGPDAPGLPQNTGLPPELLFGNPAMEEDYQRMKKLQAMTEDDGEGEGGGRANKDKKRSEKLAAKSWRDDPWLSGRTTGGVPFDDSAFDGQGEHVGRAAHNVARSKRFGGDVPLLLLDEEEEGEDDEEPSQEERPEESSEESLAELSAEQLSRDDDQEEKEEGWVEREGRLVTGGGGRRFPAYLDDVMQHMRQAAAESLKARKRKHAHGGESDEDEDVGDWEEEGEEVQLLSDESDSADEAEEGKSSKALESNDSVSDKSSQHGWDDELHDVTSAGPGCPNTGKFAEMDDVSGGWFVGQEEENEERNTGRKSLASMFKRQNLSGRLGKDTMIDFEIEEGGGEEGGSDWEEEMRDDINQKVPLSSLVKGRRSMASGDGDGQVRATSPHGARHADDADEKEEEGDAQAVLERMLGGVRGPGGSRDDHDPYDDEAASEEMLSRMILEARDRGMKVPLSEEEAEAALDKLLRDAGHPPLDRTGTGSFEEAFFGGGLGDQEKGAAETKAFPEVDAQNEFDKMLQDALRNGDSGKGGGGGRDDGFSDERGVFHGAGEEIEGLLSEAGEGVQVREGWDEQEEAGHSEDEGPRWMVQKDGNDRWEEGEDGKLEPWRPIMHLRNERKRVVIHETVDKLARDAMAAARRADSAAGYSGSGPATQAVMDARLRCLTEPRLKYRAVRFIEEEYPAQGVRVKRQAAQHMVDMYTRIGGHIVEEAVRFEEKARKEYGVKPDRRMLSSILQIYSKQGNAKMMTKMLDLMQELDVPIQPSALRHIRMMVDKGRFSHSYLPVDPQANEKRMAALVKKCKKPDTPALRQIRSLIMKAKHIGSMGKRC